MFTRRQVKSRRCSPSRSSRARSAVSMSLGAAVTAPQPAPRPPALDRPIPTDFKLTHDERVLLNLAKYRDWRDKPEAYLRSPAHRARPNLTTPEGLWGSAVPMWAFSAYHLIRRPSREQALLEARNTLSLRRGTRFHFQELSDGCAWPRDSIMALPILDNESATARQRKTNPFAAMTGPVGLVQCLKWCKKTAGCGAVAFFFLQRRMPQDRRKQGLCALKKKQCLREAKVGKCPYNREWCTFQLLRRKPETAPKTDRYVPATIPAACRPAQPTLVYVANWSGMPLDLGSSVCQQLGQCQGARMVPDQVDTRRVFVRTDVVLGGGLNNMLMNVAQLLDQSCGAGATLVMPRLDADPLWMFDPKDGDQQKTKPTPLRFDALFDWPHFVRRVAPCAVELEPPRGARLNYTKPTGLRNGWSSPSIIRTVATVYKAVRPNGVVQELIDALKREAVRHAGERWAAVHLPIEMDWWFGPGWCEPKAFEDYTRRCYTPAEAATATWAVRRSLEASGTILLFAHEKVHSHGPNLCFEKFGERTVKLALDRRHIPYLYRNAAEQFLAADAPGGFYGNAYSTMSKAVALLRSAHSDPRLRGASWAYDCALANSRSRWFPPRSNESVVTNHPGFPYLQTLPGQCPEVAAPPGTQLPATEGVRCFNYVSGYRCDPSVGRSLD